MQQYRLLTRRLAETTALRTAGLWLMLADGDLTDDEFVGTAALAVQTGREQAVTLADLAIAATIGVAPLGLTLPDQTDRLTLAMGTLLERADQPDLPDGPWLLNRLSRAEPLDAGRQGTSESLRGQGVERWRRVTGGAPCPVCADLAIADSLPATVDMWGHTGCSCVQQPITD